MIQTGLPAFIVTKSTALARKTHHQYLTGIGYVAHHGPPELPKGLNGTANCNPPPGTADGSLHFMQPPNGHPQIAMKWVAVDGRRLRQKALIKGAAAILGDETMHWAVLLNALGENPVPAAFIS